MLSEYYIKQITNHYGWIYVLRMTGTQFFALFSANYFFRLLPYFWSVIIQFVFNCAHKSDETKTGRSPVTTSADWTRRDYLKNFLNSLQKL